MAWKVPLLCPGSELWCGVLQGWCALNGHTTWTAILKVYWWMDLGSSCISRIMQLFRANLFGAAFIYCDGCVLVVRLATLCRSVVGIVRFQLCRWSHPLPYYRRRYCRIHRSSRHFMWIYLLSWGFCGKKLTQEEARSQYVFWSLCGMRCHHSFRMEHQICRKTGYQNMKWLHLK